MNFYENCDMLWKDSIKAGCFLKNKFKVGKAYQEIIKT